MPITSHDLKSASPRHNEVRIKEPINEKWQVWFDEFTSTRTEAGETLLK